MRDNVGRALPVPLCDAQPDIPAGPGTGRALIE
jgi:hypothetical protein